MAADPKDIVKQGYVQIKTDLFAGLLARWTKKWLILCRQSSRGSVRLIVRCNNQSDESDSDRRSVSLSDFVIIDQTQNDRGESSITIVFKSTSPFQFRTDSKNELDHWYDALRITCSGPVRDSRCTTSGAESFNVDLLSNGLIPVTGECILQVSFEDLTVFGGNNWTTESYSWPLNTIRRFGNPYKDCFTFEAGRSGPYGEGLMNFTTVDAQLIDSKLRKVTQSMIDAERIRHRHRNRSIDFIDGNDTTFTAHQQTGCQSSSVTSPFQQPSASAHLGRCRFDATTSGSSPERCFTSGTTTRVHAHSFDATSSSDCTPSTRSSNTSWSHQPAAARSHAHSFDATSPDYLANESYSAFEHQDFQTSPCLSATRTNSGVLFYSGSSTFLSSPPPGEPLPPRRQPLSRSPIPILSRLHIEEPHVYSNSCPTTRRLPPDGRSYEPTDAAPKQLLAHQSTRDSSISQRQISPGEPTFAVISSPKSFDRESGTRPWNPSRQPDIFHAQSPSMTSSSQRVPYTAPFGGAVSDTRMAAQWTLSESVESEWGTRNWNTTRRPSEPNIDVTDPRTIPRRPSQPDTSRPERIVSSRSFRSCQMQLPPSRELDANDAQVLPPPRWHHTHTVHSKTADFCSRQNSDSDDY